MINNTESERRTLNKFYEGYCRVQSDVKKAEEVIYATREPKAIELLKDLKGITPQIIGGAIIAELRGLSRKDGDTQADQTNPIFIDKEKGVIRTERSLPETKLLIIEEFKLYGGNK